jgi:hypothetical protein
MPWSSSGAGVDKLVGGLVEGAGTATPPVAIRMNNASNRTAIRKGRIAAALLASSIVLQNTVKLLWAIIEIFQPDFPPSMLAITCPSTVSSGRFS